MPHEVLIGIAENVIPFGTVLTEIQCGIFKNSDQIGQTFHHVLAAAKFVRVGKVRHFRKLVCLCDWADDLFIDVVADSGLAF